MSSSENFIGAPGAIILQAPPTRWLRVEHLQALGSVSLPPTTNMGSERRQHLSVESAAKAHCVHCISVMLRCARARSGSRISVKSTTTV
jgi:hypothetical protein